MPTCDKPDALKYARFQLSTIDGRLRILRSDGEPLGVMSSGLYSPFKRLIASECMLVDPVIPIAAYAKASQDWKRIGTSARCTVELNIYSHRHAAIDTGKLLAEAGLYLQTPGQDFRQLSYHNPQYLDVEDVMDVDDSVLVSTLSHLEDNEGDFDSNSGDISSVIDHLPQPKYLRESLVDERIITTLHRQVFPNCVIGL